MSQFKPPTQQQWQTLHYPLAPETSEEPSLPLPPGTPRKLSSTTKLVLTLSLILLAALFIGIMAVVSHSSSSSTSHNAGMSEQQYKDSTTTITVADLDKDGNTVSGGDVHFTATILSFVKDSNGDTAGANVTDPDSFSSIIQVIFPDGTDITQLNTQDTIEVWGTDEGVFSGSNAFGATVHEVAVQALYLNDQTTGYTTG